MEGIPTDKQMSPPPHPLLFFSPSSSIAFNTSFVTGSPPPPQSLPLLSFFVLPFLLQPVFNTVLTFSYLSPHHFNSLIFWSHLYTVCTLPPLYPQHQSNEGSIINTSHVYRVRKIPYLRYCLSAFK